MPETPPLNSATMPPAGARRLLRRYLPRLLLAAMLVLATLKAGDVLVGQMARTRERHLLRLAPGASVRHKSNEFDYVFRANRLGLRGPDVPFTKPAGTFRIVVLGDSFVAGYGVADQHLMTTLLQERLAGRRLPAAQPRGGPTGAAAAPEVEVVNVGRVGTSTIRELDLYEALGRRFHPDLVILAYYLGNDLAEVVQEQTHAELENWHPAGWSRRLAFASYPNLYLELALLVQSRRQLREFTSRSEAEIADDLRHEARARGVDPQAAVANFKSLSPAIRGEVASGMLSEQRVIDSCIEPDRLVRALDPDDAFFNRAWRRTSEYLDRLQKAVERDGARLAVVAIPAPFQIDRKSLEFHAALGYEVREGWLRTTPRTAAALADWAQRAGIACLELSDRFREAAEPLYFIEDVHFTPAGNAAAAEAIAEFLIDRKLIP